MMDEAVSAHVHYNAHYLFFSARLSALQEMPEWYWTHEERREAHLILPRGFAARCMLTQHTVIHQSLMKILRGDCSFSKETHSSLAVNDELPLMPIIPCNMLVLN